VGKTVGDYILYGLSPRDFEHMVQALAIDAIGPGVTPFGDGPDGGREATFRGKSQYPSVAEPWDGYIVLQCKFAQRPSGDVKKDGEWALAQLKAELDKFLDAERKLPCPQYFLFVTNVVLTAAQDVGSKDKVVALIEQYRERLGLKDYGVWDYDKLRSLLDNSAEVRRRYLGHIVAGDVLAEMMRFIEMQSADFGSIISRFLQKQLQTDLYARLEQAGHVAEHRIALAQVFTDLPG
jgi:hypothetical protein